MPKPLIILESPGKVKNVKHYTDDKCDVMATIGHIKDLPQNAIGINEDAEGKIDFKSIKYVPLPDKVDVIKRIKAQAQGRDVLLATDPDREGESISYDVYGEIKRNASSIKRIEIHEITPKGVAKALKSPRNIDNNIVDAQRTRRFIDRLAGYKLTKYAAEALGTSQWIEASVGRTQSAALKLVYDRDKEIENFVPVPYWKVVVKDRYGNTFTSRKFDKEEDAQRLVAQLGKGLAVANIEKTRTKETPPAPLTASTLQQNASRKFGYMPEKTMQIAQTLFNNSHITYMRTDSVRLADETIDQIRKYLDDAFEGALPPKPRVHTDKGGAVQGAHEAIHPTVMTAKGAPEAMTGFSDEEKNIYKMIWDYAMASQAADAEWNVLKVSAAPVGGKEPLVSSGKTLASAGWRAIMSSEKEDKEQESPALAVYKINDRVQGKPQANREETKPPAYYTVNTLLKALEKNEVGRPATWATIVKTILNRNYVSENKGTVKHTPKGDAMVQWLMAVCPQLASVRFTALMEQSLADIEAGKARKEDIVNEFNAVLNRSIEKAKQIPSKKYHFEGVDYSNKNTYSASKSTGTKSYPKSGARKLSTRTKTSSRSTGTKSYTKKKSSSSSKYKSKDYYPDRSY